MKVERTSETTEEPALPGIYNTSQESHAPSIAIDYALYEAYLADSDWSDEEKQAFLDALWQIIVAFVDLGFGVHPLLQAEGAADIKEILGVAPNPSSVLELEGAPDRENANTPHTKTTRR